MMELRLTTYPRIALSMLLVVPGLLFGQDSDLFGLTNDDIRDSDEVVDLSITRVTDPAGHGCCVQSPPLQINLFTENGSLNIGEIDGVNSIPWLSFGPMQLDSNLGFQGESRSTVAGFGDILTILTGTITAEDKITAEIKVGADGGLPSGAPITFDVEFKPATVFAFIPPQPASQESLSLDTVATNIGDILIGERDYPPASGLDLFISINVGAETANADWWIVMQDNSKESDNLSYFDLALGAWQPGFVPSHQGPLMSVPEPFKLLEGFVPESNDFVIVFGVDREQNGVFDPGLATVIGSRFRTGI